LDCACGSPVRGFGSYRMKRPFASRRYREKPAQSGLLLTGSAFNRPQDGIAS
jgi:hypothetical protein